MQYNSREWGPSAMIELPYSLVIEATEELDYFGFYSPDLAGFTGIGRSIEDCLHKAKRGMKEHLELLKGRGLPVPEPNPDPTITIQNAKDPAVPEPGTGGVKPPPLPRPTTVRGKSGTGMGCLVMAMLMLLILIVCGRCQDSTTNQELLDQHHGKGRFLGYKDGDKWAKDIMRLHEAAEEVRRRGR